MRSSNRDINRERKTGVNTVFMHLPKKTRAGTETGQETEIKIAPVTERERKEETETNVKAVEGLAAVAPSVVMAARGVSGHRGNLARSVSAAAGVEMSLNLHITDTKNWPLHRAPAGTKMIVVITALATPIGRVRLPPRPIERASARSAVIARSETARGRTSLLEVNIQRILLYQLLHTNTTSGLMTENIWAPLLACLEGKEIKERMVTMASHLMMKMRKNSGRRIRGKRIVTGI